MKTRNQAIKDRLNYYLDKGMTEKMEIYTKVVDDLGVARPIVRRVARELRSELLHRVEVLQSDFAGLKVNQK